MTETATSAARPTGRVRRDDVAVAVGLLALCLLRVVPYLLAGPGFYMDDWRNLARLETVGWLRAAEAGKFASRPGAWSVETVLYTTLGDHPVWWVVALAVLGAATGTALFITMRRFVPPWTALAVVVVWIVLPNHTSLRVFANTAPMTVGLLLLTIGVWCMDEDRLVLGALVASAGGLCYEVTLLPALTAVIVLHLFRHRGSRRRALQAGAVVLVTGGLMLIHPTYDPGGAARGSPVGLGAAHFGSGLSEVGPLAVALAVAAVAGIVVGVVQFARGRRGADDGPWLVVVGLGIMAVGLASFALKWPTGVRGQADRNYVVSSVGSAMVWVGCAQVLFARSRLALGGAACAFVLVVAQTNVAYQQQWGDAAQETVAMLQAVDCRYDGDPPEGLAVGPFVPVRNSVRTIQQFYLGDASQVVTGERYDFELTDSQELWEDRPEDLRVTWAELLAEGC